mgnify:CR=1 FL=1
MLNGSWLATPAGAGRDARALEEGAAVDGLGENAVQTLGARREFVTRRLRSTFS